VRYLSTPSSAADDRKFVKCVVKKKKKAKKSQEMLLEKEISAISELMQAYQDPSQYQPCGT
jgi:galactokinase